MTNGGLTKDQARLLTTGGGSPGSLTGRARSAWASYASRLRDFASAVYGSGIPTVAYAHQAAQASPVTACVQECGGEVTCAGCRREVFAYDQRGNVDHVSLCSDLLLRGRCFGEERDRCSGR
jgi:hypothetical protein